MKGYSWNRMYDLRELKREARILNNVKHNNKKTKTETVTTFTRRYI